jgi:hypothetical protein
MTVIAPVGAAEASKMHHESGVLQNFHDYLRQRVPVG